MLTAILMFLQNNWKILVVGLAAAALMGYIGVLKISRDHYKSKAQELQLVINQANAREEQLKLGNEAITNQYKAVLKESNEKTDKILVLTKERIKNDKELNALRVSLNAVRLFNDSKRDPTSVAPAAKQGDEGTSEGSATFKGITPTVTLAQVFTQVAENDALHWKCVKQVQQWQTFWHDYEMNYNGVSSVSP